MMLSLNPLVSRLNCIDHHDNLTYVNILLVMLALYHLFQMDGSNIYCCCIKLKVIFEDF